MAVNRDTIIKLLNRDFPGDKFELINLDGTGDHYGLYIESKKFGGKTRVQQHKMVNDSLKDILKGDLHALAIKTKVVEG